MAGCPSCPRSRRSGAASPPALDGATIESAEIVDPRLTRPVDPADVAGRSSETGSCQLDRSGQVPALAGSPAVGRSFCARCARRFARGTRPRGTSRRTRTVGSTPRARQRRSGGRLPDGPAVRDSGRCSTRSTCGCTVADPPRALEPGSPQSFTAARLASSARADGRSPVNGIPPRPAAASPASRTHLRGTRRSVVAQIHPLRPAR
jgi:hypothetical protein